MSEQLSPGDTVRLKSGGPLMTVEGDVGNNRIAVKWFDDNNQLKEGVFEANTLELDDGTSPSVM